MSARRASWLVLAAIVAVALAIGSGAGRGGEPSPAARTARIASEVRCPTCEGLSAQDSSTPAADAIRDVIRERVEAGESDAEIKGYLADRYGRDILLKPDAGGIGLVVWALPVAGALAGALALALALRRWQAASRAPAPAPAPAAGPAPVLVTGGGAPPVEEGVAGGPDPVEAAGAAQAPGSGATRRPAVRRLGLAAGALALASLAGWGVASAAGERAPGGAATGDIPSSIGGLLARAKAQVGEGEVLAAIQTYDEVIAVDPRNPEALAYKGWLIRLAGRQSSDPALIDKGLASIEQAIAADPAYPDARFFRGLILYQDKGDPAGAVVELRAFLDGNPPRDMIALVQDTLRRAEADAAAKAEADAVRAGAAPAPTSTAPPAP